MAPEAHLDRGGAGVDAFVTLGGRETLFQLLVLQLRKPRPNRLEIQGRKPLEIVLDGRGGIGSFTGAPTASATADSATIRAERRRALAERLAELGQLAQLDCQLRPGAGEPPMGERAVPLVEAMTQWVDLALTPVGSDPIQRAFESRLFEYPMTHSADDWGTSRLPLDRLQQRFVSDSLASGRTLRDILSFSPLGRPRTWRTLVLLDAMGLLHFEKEPPASGRAMAQGELMDTLRRRHTQGQESHFAALAAHYASHPSELAPALERIVLRYGPASPAAQSSPEARALCEGIVTAAREAHQVLGDRARRIAYRKSVLTPTEVQGAVDLMIGQLRLALMRRLPELVQSLADVIEELDQGALARAGIQL